MRNIITVSCKILFSLLLIFLLTSALQWVVDGFDGMGHLVFSIISNFSFPILIYFLVRLFNKKFNFLNKVDYGFTLTQFFKKLLTGILLAVLIVGSVLLLAALFGVSFTFTGLQKNAIIPLLQMIAANWVFGAWEEMYFRGLVFNTLLKAKLNFHKAALITAILFTVLHAGSYDMTETTALWFIVVMLLSYILLYIYLLTRSIWAPIAFHFSWDFLWNLMNDSENKVGLLQVNLYTSHAILMDNLTIPVLGIALLVMLYVSRKKQLAKSYCLELLADGAI